MLFTLAGNLELSIGVAGYGGLALLRTACPVASGGPTGFLVTILYSSLSGLSRGAW